MTIIKLPYAAERNRHTCLVTPGNGDGAAACARLQPDLIDIIGLPGKKSG